jgi:hypothetical protein
MLHLARLLCFAAGHEPMNVIPFPRQPRRRFPEPVTPPQALGGEISRHEGRAVEDDLEDRRRMQQNVATMALVVVLVLAGTWMIERLRVYSKTMACIESGHRSCTLVDPRHLPPR